MPSLRTVAALLSGPRLYLLPRGTEERGNRRPRDPRLAALIGLLIALLLVVGGLFLVRQLGRMGRLQDCVMSGRSNCAPIDPDSPGG